MFGLGVPAYIHYTCSCCDHQAASEILKEYERAVVFRLGRMVGARGPGLVLHHSRYREKW